MQTYDYCCSKDGHGLAYPQFSVVFIHTFSVNRCLELFLPEDAVRDDYETLTDRMADEACSTNVWRGPADFLECPVVYVNQNIERQIFVMRGKEDALVKKKICRGKLVEKRLYTRPVLTSCGEGESSPFVWTFGRKAVYRCSLRGFDFLMPLRPAEDEDFPPVDLAGHASVEMSIFFGNTVSLTYRFFFDGNSAKVLAPGADDGEPVAASAITDHLIALLSIHLGAEYWSSSHGEQEGRGERLSSQSNINLESTLVVKDFWIDEDGFLTEPSAEPWVISGEGRTFDEVALRYKKYLYNYHTAYREVSSHNDRMGHEKYRRCHGVSVRNDQHYAMVDIWENVMHPVSGGGDLFSGKAKKRLTEAEIITHIKEFHKPELVGLMTLYPGEWPYRHPDAYDEVCGENIAIDTDDLVLVGTNLAVVIGTYGRRGNAADESRACHGNASGDAVRQGVDWAGHLRERARYHVSWPEYLLILQMVLAKKHVIAVAKDKMIDVALTAKDRSSEELIGENADLGIRLSRMVLQLDIVKYSKFASHLVMFDRTTRRLRLEKDMEELRGIIAMVNESLRNLSDYKAMKSDFLLNTILLIISCASTFELFFQRSEMPFLTYFDVKSDGIAAWLVTVVATITVFAILLALKSTAKKIWQMFIKK